MADLSAALLIDAARAVTPIVLTATVVLLALAGAVLNGNLALVALTVTLAVPASSLAVSLAVLNVTLVVRAFLPFSATLAPWTHGTHQLPPISSAALPYGLQSRD